ncbi:HAD-superfamily hydrolase, subfamily IIA [Gordonia bronchialis DSM 43247]|uniref:HAD-superfamily hydrolase, subfamily IIA n=1 Tax=Gordonia bronchialis (strain ATCC 25592 / DSM 43247 / BCRC 13721 / JCM 3198 / KCTC 3076 / NBRC 16047 / NCTC 10667) TaxID=526226 RepID=D0L2B6_GORB4|nr:HAD-IIA family hydrolase [Gordonia bronchialis]ACY20003.1 HAD-superfamily hydrolase, subfamily IIA [Gordonia bronchialis DSM 43247]MCC3322776.1 HAD-IIA family hydrolase [Gordonia bronchialis]QGS26143.1 HAD-IIA family hydrolase [Gordonia bronchialis]STQ62784.1 UMP phosphatase [Gordonia bronchialis]
MALGVLLDIDGVMVTSWKALPGAVDALAELADRAVPRMFLTNTTSRSRGEIAQLLGDCGFDVDASEILTAAALTAEYVSSTFPDKRVWVLNQGPIAEDMVGVELTDDPSSAQVIVLGGAGPVFTHDALSKVLELMLDGVPAIAMHRSMTWSTADGLKIDTGVYLEGLEKAVGRKIKAIGKPSPLGFRAAVDLMQMEPTQVVMVGDDMHNDVLGAQASALIGVLVRTGKFREEALRALQRDEFGPVPDHVIDSVADLPTLLDKLA